MANCKNLTNCTIRKQNANCAKTKKCFEPGNKNDLIAEQIGQFKKFFAQFPDWEFSATKKNVKNILFCEKVKRQFLCLNNKNKPTFTGTIKDKNYYIFLFEKIN